MHANSIIPWKSSWWCSMNNTSRCKRNHLPKTFAIKLVEPQCNLMVWCWCWCWHTNGQGSDHSAPSMDVLKVRSLRSQSIGIIHRFLQLFTPPEGVPEWASHQFLHTWWTSTGWHGNPGPPLAWKPMASIQTTKRQCVQALMRFSPWQPTTNVSQNITQF